MNTYLVAVIDGAIARFLTLHPLEMPEYESGPNLVERDRLVNSNKEQQGEDLWATTKPGRNRGTFGQAHGYGDHREQHMNEFDRRFAQSITQQVNRLIQTYESTSLILVSAPQTLGILRDVLIPNLSKPIPVHELAKDLCALKPREIHDYLAKREVLPAYHFVAPSKPGA
jgi:protein required for attachment to host cells